MSCNRCEVVPAAVEAEFLLLSTPHISTKQKLEAHASAAEIPCEVTELGVKLTVAGRSWEVMLSTLAAAMTEPERTDTYVAVIPRGGDAWAMQKAIFQSRCVQDRLTQMSGAWLYDVLRKDSLQIHFQPLVRSTPAGSSVFGYECLMRGVAGDGTLIPPMKMLSAAKSLDMLFLLDQKCRLAAVRHASDHATAAPPGTMFFINFLPTAIYNPEHCLQSTMTAVNAGILKPEQICFEVVETEDVGDREHLVKILQYYRERGFKVALDDVGAGYSSLIALAALRPDYVKLDRELVLKAATHSLEGKLVRDLADTCRQHQIQPLAEGVETMEHLRFVNSCGIELTQGWVYAKPSPQLLAPEQAAAIATKAASARLPAAA
jgi:EAL domain-containing protein (putative c-di-GMP-specific phosphodiesterase class I)